MGLVSEVKTVGLWPAKMAKPSTEKVDFVTQHVKNYGDSEQW